MVRPDSLPPAQAPSGGRSSGVLAVCIAALAVSACTPTYDWREVRLPDTGLTALFPCKPSSAARQVALAGVSVPMVMHACSAGSQTWAVSFVALGDPARVTAALQALRAAAAANLDANAGSPMPLTVPGATPHAASGRERLQGRRPDGQTVVAQLGVFVYGATVFQAMVLGDSVPADLAEAFFASLRVGL